MRRKTWKAVPIVALSALVLASCATRIPLEAQRTPTLDTSDVQRIAVVPFAPLAEGADHQTIANTITSEVSSRLAETNAFILVDYSVVTAARARGDDIGGYVDALLVGRITRFGSNVVSLGPLQTIARREAIDRANSLNPIAGAAARVAATIMFPYYRLIVDVAFDYHLVMARDGSIVGPVGRAGRAVVGRDNRNNLPAGSTLVPGIVENQLALFYRDVIPHTVTIRRVLETEPNSALRPYMNAALGLVRAGDFVSAREQYIAIWEDHGSVAAAINAAILYEATGHLETAIVFMDGVAAQTGNPRANAALARLNSEMGELLGLEAFEDERTPVERVAEHAIAEVGNALPDGANVWIHNAATAHQGMANEVIDNMIYAFIGRGITVVEREFMDLIATEQELHLDGGVSDADFISVGNLAGAHAIVTVNVVGAGAARRLQVRVLDIKTATVRMQSGTGALWNL